MTVDKPLPMNEATAITPVAPRQARRSLTELGWLSRGMLAVATIFMLVGTGIMVVEGMSRHFLNVSYFWAEESVRFLLLWAFFLTLGVAGFKNYHIRTELLVQRLPMPVQRFLWVMACVAGMLFASILAYSSIAQVRRYYTMGMLSESNLEMPMWIVFLAMPVGGVALFIYYVSAAVYAVKWGDPFESVEEPAEADEATMEALLRGPQ